MTTYALDLPYHVYGYVDRRFLSDGTQTGWEPAVWFGLTTPANRALGLTVLLQCGAVYRGLPPHSWASTTDAPAWTLPEAQAWDNFGRGAQMIEYQYLRELPVRLLDHPDQPTGSYLFTVEWGDDGFSRYPGQTKCFHAVELDHGRLTFRPNNHLLWHESSFTTPSTPTWLQRDPTVWGVETWPTTPPGDPWTDRWGVQHVPCSLECQLQIVSGQAVCPCRQQPGGPYATHS